MDDVKIDELWNIYKTLLLSTKREGIDKLVEWLENGTDFKYAPASTQYHCSFRGGLLKHSLNVYYAMYDFKNILDFLEVDDNSIIITSLLHDICKVNCYTMSTKNVKDETGQWKTVPFYLFDEEEPLGHAEKSIMLIYEQGVKLTKIERAMIRNHMGFTSNDDERRINKLFRICPQTLVLHWADELATFILEGYDMPKRFQDKLMGRNLTECIQQAPKKQNTEVTIDGFTYELAPEDAVVDNEEIIQVKYNGNLIKVYAPYSDGLPF